MPERFVFVRPIMNFLPWLPQHKMLKFLIKLITLTSVSDPLNLIAIYTTRPTRKPFTINELSIILYMPHIKVKLFMSALGLC